MDQLLAGGGGRDWLAVCEDRVLLPSERDTTERCDQWFASLAALDADLQALVRPVRRLDRGPVLAGHLRDRRAVLAGQRLEQRGLHHPVQPVESVDVAGEQVVLDDAPVLRPVAADDRVVLLVHQLGPARGLPPPHVAGAFGLDHVLGHVQPDLRR